VDFDVMVYRIVAAIAAGAAVGLERQFRDKPAGLRTLVLISAGACIFSMVSILVPGKMADQGRIAAQIVTGVGFLGAGSILRSTKSIYGLTTAATIWIAAALGMACGFGHFLIAVVGAITTLVVLILFHSLGARIDVSRTIRKHRIATRDDQIRLADLEPYFSEAGLQILRRNCYRQGDDYVFTFRVQGPRKQHLALREKLLHTDGLILQR